MGKLKAGIIGSGNIGCDLLMKIARSPYLECSLFMGRNLDSKGMKFAYRHGAKVTDKSIHALEEDPSLCDIVFDATTASAHLVHAPILKRLGKFAIDLTPSLVGKMCVPLVNGEECLAYDNVNMITCGGQATVPIANAISKVVGCPEYVEIVASISSNSAGPGTRANIDEFTQTTKQALLEFTGAASAKAIIILNPAQPPIMMHNTIYVVCPEPPKKELVDAIKSVRDRMKEYMPGYSIVKGPVYIDGKIVVMVQLEGRGDYLPKYSGNLDVITASAVRIAEMYAQRRMA